MRRVTLTDRETREKQMKQHVQTVAQSIVDDTSGDAIFERYLKIKSNVHRYSIGNRMLMAWQAPDSALIASRTAFSKMAQEQGHAGKPKTSKKGKSWEEHVHVASGAKAVWIWGAPRPCTIKNIVEDPTTGETTEEVRTFTRFSGVDVYQIEEIRYADTGEPFEAPTFVQPIHDEGLFDALLAFAASEGITVNQQVPDGALGVSHIGRIGLRKCDHWTLQVSTLIHELAHELLHDLHDRLGGDRTLHESEAETTSAVVLGYLGHETTLSASYLRNHGAKPSDVLGSMDRIAKAAGRIVDAIEAHRIADPRPKEAAGAADPTDPMEEPTLLLSTA